MKNLPRSLQPKIRYVLLADVVFMDAADTGVALDPSVAKVLSREHSRLPSRALSADLTRLLEEFRSASSVVEAAARFASKNGSTAKKVLREALGPLQELLDAGYLEAETAETAQEHSHRLPVAVSAEADAVQIISTKDRTALFRVLHRRWGPVVVRVAEVKDGPGCRRLQAEEDGLNKLLGLRVPKVIESSQDVVYRWLVSSWIEGCQMGRFIAEMRRMPHLFSLASRTVTAASLIELMAEIHGRGLVHGDINPKNFIVDKTGEVHALDFESSTGLGEPYLMDEASPFYAAPEQPAFGEGGAFFSPTPLAEQYSTAVLCAELMFNAVRPDLSLTLAALLERVRDGVLWNMHFPMMSLQHAGVAACLERAMARDPGERHASLADMLMAFEHAEKEVVGSSRLEPSRDPTFLGHQVNHLWQGLLVGSEIRPDKKAADPPPGSGGEVALAASFVGPVNGNLVPEAVMVLERLLPLDTASWTPELTGWAAALLAPQKSARPDDDLGLAVGNGARLWLAALLLEMCPEESHLLQAGRDLLIVNLADLKKPGLRLGVAHGALGNQLAIANWCAVAGELMPFELVDASLRRIREECMQHRDGSPVQRGWWCRGMPGYMTLLCTLARLVPDQADEVRDLLTDCAGQVLKLPEAPAWILCCGTLGQALALAQTAEVLGDPGLRAQALDRLEIARLAASSGGHLPSIWKGSFGLVVTDAWIHERRFEQAFSGLVPRRRKRVSSDCV